MTTYSSYNAWSRTYSNPRQPHGSSHVNVVHHTVCRQTTDDDTMRFSVQRRRPDSYDVPATSQKLLQLDAVSSRRLRARLCSASRVYCGNNILNIHRNIYAKPRPKSVQYRWSPPEISLALPKIQRAKTAGLIRLRPVADQTAPNTRPQTRLTKSEDDQHNVHPQAKTKSRHRRVKEEGIKQSGDGDEAAGKKTDDQNKDQESKPGADDSKLAADDTDKEADDMHSTGKENEISQSDKEDVVSSQQRTVVHPDSKNKGKKYERKKKEKKKAKHQKKEAEDKKAEQREEDEVSQRWQKISRKDNSDDDYSSDDTRD